MTAPMVLSTDGLPEKETAAAWQGWMAQLFSGLDTDLYGDTCFDGHLSVAYAGDVMLTKLEAGRHRVIRGSHRQRDSEAAYLKIVAPWSGHAEVEQCGSRTRVGNGSWAIYDTSQPYVVDNPLRTEHLIMMVPKQSIAERGLRLENLMGLSVGGSTGMARIALQTMRSTYQELDNMTAPLARRAGELLVDMVHLSLQALGGQATAVTQKQALYERICDHVASHVRDPGLSVDQVAQALNCSRRHLHNAFAGREQSLGAFIQQSRLELCMRELHSAALAHRTITEIAMGCGFGNSAHFSRAFKSYAGMSPSEFRALGH